PKASRGTRAGRPQIRWASARTSPLPDTCGPLPETVGNLLWQPMAELTGKHGDLTPTIPSDSTIAAAWPLTTELCRGEPPFALPPVFAPADPVGDRVAHAFGQSRHRFAAHRLSRAVRRDG